MRKDLDRATKKALLKSIISAGSTFLTLVLVLVAFFGTSYSWFSQNRKTTSTGMSVHAPFMSTLEVVDVCALHYDGKYDAVCWHIDPDEGTDVTMSEYDLIFRDRNVNTPMIFRIVVAGVPHEADSTITVTVPCTEKYIDVVSADGTRTATNEYEGDYTVNNEEITLRQYLSNVVEIKVGCGLLDETTGNFTPDVYDPVPTYTATEANNVTIFHGVRDALMDEEALEHYVTDTFATKPTTAPLGDGTAHTFTKKDTVELELPYSYYKDYLFTPVNGNSPAGATYSETGTYLILNVVFDYNNDLADTFEEFKESDLAGTVEFASDIHTIYVKEGKEG